MSTANPDLSRLALEIKLGEAIEIDGGRITVMLEHKFGQTARLVFVSERTIPIRLKKNRGASQEAVVIS